MANRNLRKIPIDGYLVLKKIKQKHGSIKHYGELIGLNDRTIRNYIKDNAIPAKTDIITAFSDLIDQPIIDPETKSIKKNMWDIAFKTGYDSGFRAGYEKCLSELSAKFYIWIESLKE